MLDDQSYLWSQEWQVDEQRAVTELARGEGREFDNTDAAICWLLAEEEH